MSKYFASLVDRRRRSRGASDPPIKAHFEWGKNVGLNTRGNDRAERFEEDPSGVRFQDTLLWLASPISRAITRRGATHRP